MLVTIPHARGRFVNYAAFGETYTSPTPSDWDGSTMSSARGSDLSGNADAKTGIISVWLRLDGSDATNMSVLANSGTPDFFLRRGGGNRFVIQGENSAGTVILTLTSNTTYTTGATWRHILASWDLAAGVGYMYLNDTSDLQAGATLTNDTIDYTKANWGIGSDVAGTAKFNGCLSEVFFHNTFLDISQQSNRRLFISAAGKPVGLGADGSRPLGVQPLIYVPNGDPATNLGSGGNFTVTGTLGSCSSNPSS